MPAGLGSKRAPRHGGGRPAGRAAAPRRGHPRSSPSPAPSTAAGPGRAHPGAEAAARSPPGPGRRRRVCPQPRRRARGPLPASRPFVCRPQATAAMAAGRGPGWWGGVGTRRGPGSPPGSPGSEGRSSAGKCREQGGLRAQRGSLERQQCLHEVLRCQVLGS